MDAEKHQVSEEIVSASLSEEIPCHSLSQSDSWNCRTCGLKLSNELFVCPNDGATRADRIVGDSISIKYEIVGELGSGGMSLVYKARHKITNGVVAIKMLRASKFDAASLQRFEQEARVISSFEHPAIVGLRDFGLTDSEQPYMVLDYVDGITLADAISRRTLSVDESMEVFQQVCDGLRYAHMLGVVHRDIKPSNIMLLKDGSTGIRVKILDFGIAKVVDLPGVEMLTRAGDVFGSPAYMSPEQACGKPVDQRSDIYSLGVVMFETLTGVPPFAAQDAIDVATGHLERPAPHLRSKAPWLSATLEEIVSKSLAKNPDHRFQSMSELGIALRKAQHGKNLSTGPKSLRQKWRQYFLIGVVTLLGISLGTLTWFLVKPLDAPISKSKNVTEIAAPEFLSTTNDGKLAKEELALHYNDKVVILKDLFGQITEQDLAQFDKAERPEKISLEETDVTGPGLAHLIHLNNLHALNLYQSGLSDRALVEIGHMTQLENLDLSKTNVDDGGLKELKHLRNLKVLNLIDESRVTSAGLSNLVGLDKLSELNLSKSLWITRSGLTELAKIPALETLRLNMGSVKDGDLKEMSNFKSLKLLALRKTDIGDAGVAELVHTRIARLDLGATKITDRSLPLLASMPTLTDLGLHECKLSAAAIEKLQIKRPDLMIYWDSPEFLLKLKGKIGRETQIYSDVAGEFNSGHSPKRPQDYDVPFNRYEHYF